MNLLRIEELFGKRTISYKMESDISFVKETKANKIEYKGWDIKLDTVDGNQKPTHIKNSDIPR